MVGSEEGERHAQRDEHVTLGATRMTASSAPPPRRRAWPIWLALAACVAIVAAIVATSAIFAPQELPPPPQIARQPPVERATDSPGPPERFGFEEEELVQAEPEELIARAMQTTSIEAIETGAAGGDALARTLSCLAYAYGEGRPRDFARARPLCEAAAEQGQALARYQISLFQRAGEAGYPADSAAADTSLAQAAEAGDPRALLDRGRAHMVAGRTAQGMADIQAAAEQGLRTAAFAMGNLYAEGRGVVPDARAALTWFERAADEGYAPALREAGIAFEEGRGVAPDYERARSHFARASELGDAQASLRLARMCERGVGASPDVAEARRLFQRASQQGAAEAGAELDRIGRDN